MSSYYAGTTASSTTATPTTATPTTAPPIAQDLQSLTDDVIIKMQKYDASYQAYQTCYTKNNCLSQNVDNLSTSFQALNASLNRLTNFLTQNGLDNNMTEDILVLYYQVIQPLREKIDRDEKEIQQMVGITNNAFNAPETKLDVAKNQYEGSLMLRYGFAMVATGLLFLLFSRMRNSSA